MLRTRLILWPVIFAVFVGIVLLSADAIGALGDVLGL